MNENIPKDLSSIFEEDEIFETVPFMLICIPSFPDPVVITVSRLEFPSDSRVAFGVENILLPETPEVLTAPLMFWPCTDSMLANI